VQSESKGSVKRISESSDKEYFLVQKFTARLILLNFQRNALSSFPVFDQHFHSYSKSRRYVHEQSVCSWWFFWSMVWEECF